MGIANNTGRSALLSALRLTALILISSVAVVALLHKGKWQLPIISKAALQQKAINPAFAAYISAYSGGMLSANSRIIIRLAGEFPDTAGVGKDLPEGLLVFSPTISGKALRTDANTITFVPDGPLLSGQLYEASLQLGNLIPVQAPELQVFDFTFRVIRQDFSVETGHLSPEGTGPMQLLTGTLRTADAAPDDDVEECLSALQDGTALKITWEHQGLQAGSHHFTVHNIKRGELASEVLLTADGKSLKLTKAFSLTCSVPPIDSFLVIQTKGTTEPECYVSVVFSDPLDPAQDLNGLVNLSGTKTVNLIAAGNELKIFPSEPLTGSQTLTLSSGIKNITGKTLAGSETGISFDDLKPNIRTVSNGNIIPSADGFMLAFEAVAVKAVTVDIIQILPGNVQELFRGGGFTNPDADMVYLGKPVLHKTMQLSQAAAADLSRMSRYNIDLSPFLKAEPGAVYNVSVRFNKEQAYYACTGSEPQPSAQLLEINPFADVSQKQKEAYYEDATGNYYSDDSYSYDSDEDYSARLNPCSNTYYNRYAAAEHHNVVIKQNLLSSDLGIIAKRSPDGTLFFAITDLNTAKPLEGVQLKIYTQQRDLAGRLLTNADGFAQEKFTAAPAFASAEYKGRFGYLGLGNAVSLSLSNFDVAGELPQDGLKGFIYGERGVWRPGDSLFLSVMLHEDGRPAPDLRPVVLELTNPQSQKIARLVQAEHKGGIYLFKTKTDPDAPTGTYTAKVSAGGAVFSKRLRIENVKPNRLKLSLTFGTENLYPDDNGRAYTLNAAWLYGAPAKNLRSTVEVFEENTNPGFKGFEEYSFSDATRKAVSNTQVLADARTDASGNLKFNLAFNTNVQAACALQTLIKTTVYEPGGAFSTDVQTLTRYPYTSYVGIQEPAENTEPDLASGRSHSLKLVSISAKGKSINAKLLVSMYKLTWSWWWQNEGNTGIYLSDGVYTPYKNQEVETVNGKAEFNFLIEKSQWGRYLIRVTDPASGHSSTRIVYIDSPWQDADAAEGKEFAAMLQFKPDKPSYLPGETVTLSVPGAKGRLLVSLENGRKLLHTFWQENLGGTALVRFKATADMTPNIFAHISLLQPLDQNRQAAGLPLRQYGVLNLKVENPENKLQPILQMPAVLKPSQTFGLTVKETKGRPMSYTIALVDEGLLDLTRFKTPDPYQAFNSPTGLGVLTWDMFDLVSDAGPAGSDKILAAGGDGSIFRKDASDKPIRFKPVVRFLGPFSLAENATGTHKITLPEYSGSVRTMVIASEGQRSGSTEKTTPVKQSLMLLPTLPRVLGTGEEISLPVTLFVTDNSVKSVRLSVQVAGAAAVSGSAVQEIAFTGPSEKTVLFRLKAGLLAGVAKINLSATGGGITAKSQTALPVRNPNPMVSKVQDYIVEPGQTLKADFATFGVPGSNSAQAELSTFPGLNISKRLDYLTGYPYGCLEQTISASFPHLYLPALVNPSGLPLPSDEESVKTALHKLQNFRLPEGSFSLWPGSPDADSWLTSYAGHFMLEAKRNGYSVPVTMLNSWLSYQFEKAGSFRKGNIKQADELQAYRLFTLALAQKPNMAAMNRLREEGTKNTDAGLLLAAAYKLAGQPNAADAVLKANNGRTDLKDLNSYETYGSEVQSEALLLIAMQLLNKQPEANAAARRLAAHLNADEWLSTQSTAFAIMALSRYYAQNTPSSGIEAALNLNGKASTIKTYGALLMQSLTVNSMGTNSFSVKNTAKTKLFLRVFSKGIAPAGSEKATQNGLQLSVAYTDLQGKSFDVANIPSGTDFRAEVIVEHPGTGPGYKGMALTQILPSGWEITNTRLDGTENFVQNSDAQRTDIRDDRVYTYFDLRPGERKTFRILLKAAYRGRYYLPGPAAESMYQAGISASGIGRWITVTEPALLP